MVIAMAKPLILLPLLFLAAPALAQPLPPAQLPPEITDPATAQRIADAAQGISDAVLDVRIGGGVQTVRQFLAADLIDSLHVAVTPIVLGRGERLWDGLEGLDERFEIESIASPSGVVHLLMERRR